MKTRLEIVGDVKVVVVENSVVKSPIGKVQVGEVRSSPVEKREAGSHQVEIKARSQKRKRLEENFEDSPSKYILNGTKIINGGKFQIFKCAEFGLERTTRNLTNKKSSVPKSKNAPAGSFPKCTSENPKKKGKWRGCLEM